MIFGLVVLLRFFGGLFVVCFGDFLFGFGCFGLAFFFWLVGSVKLSLVLVCTVLITVSSLVNRSE